MSDKQLELKFIRLLLHYPRLKGGCTASEGRAGRAFWINLMKTAELQIVRRRKSQGVYLCLRVRADRAFWKNLMQNYKSSESYYTTRVSRGVPVSEGMCTQGFFEKPNATNSRITNPLNLTILLHYPCLKGCLRVRARRAYG